MRREYIFIFNLTCLLLFLLFERLFADGKFNPQISRNFTHFAFSSRKITFNLRAGESGSDYSKGCAYLRCENGSRCVKRRFWCKNPPCPGMLYCSKSRKGKIRGECVDRLASFPVRKFVYFALQYLLRFLLRFSYFFN